MKLEIYPCDKQFKNPGAQCYKILSEYKEVLEAQVAYNDALVTKARYEELQQLREHLAEEIIDLVTAAVTLGHSYELDLKTAAEKVMLKNYDRGYYSV